MVVHAATYWYWVDNVAAVVVAEHVALVVVMVVCRRDVVRDAEVDVMDGDDDIHESKDAVVLINTEMNVGAPKDAMILTDAMALTDVVVGIVNDVVDEDEDSAADSTIALVVYWTCDVVVVVAPAFLFDVV